jgi:multidrug efflux pump
MSVGTLFTLFVLPCIYTLLAAPDRKPVNALELEHRPG